MNSQDEVDFIRQAQKGFINSTSYWTGGSTNSNPLTTNIELSAYRTTNTGKKKVSNWLFLEKYYLLLPNDIFLLLTFNSINLIIITLLFLKVLLYAILWYVILNEMIFARNKCTTKWLEYYTRSWKMTQ